jgi:hypothetical protein
MQICRLSGRGRTCLTERCWNGRIEKEMLVRCIAVLLAERKVWEDWRILFSRQWWISWRLVKTIVVLL